MSIFQQHSHLTSKYSSNVILFPGLELGCLRWGIGAPLIRSTIDMSIKQLLKRHKLSFRSHYKSQNNLCSPVFQPLAYPLKLRHVLNASRNCLSIQLVHMSTLPFVILVTLLLTFTCIDFRSTSHEVTPSWPQNLMLHA